MPDFEKPLYIKENNVLHPGTVCIQFIEKRNIYRSVLCQILKQPLYMKENNVLHPGTVCVQFIEKRNIGI